MNQTNQIIKQIQDQHSDKVCKSVLDFKKQLSKDELKTKNDEPN